MLIDDSKLDIFLNKKFLNISGVGNNTLEFLSARAALEYIEKHADQSNKLPDLILLDVKMPEINGFEFLEKFKELKHKLSKSINIIMLSSTLDPKDLDRANDNTDVQDMLRKPLNPQQLKSLIDQRQTSKVN